MTCERVRAVAFSALALAIVLGPSWRQVLGGENRLLRSWRMFADPGLGLVDARFALRSADGIEVPVDRYAILGLEPPRAAPTAVRRPRDRTGFEALARQICDQLGPDADLRARARLAARGGWRPLEDGERNLCAPLPDARGGA